MIKILFGMLAVLVLVYVVGLPRAFVAMEALDHAANAAYDDAEQALKDVRAARARRARGAE